MTIMKLLKIITPAVFLALLIAGCEKNKFNLKDNTFINGNAQLKVNFVSSYQNNPAVQLKIDDVRVSNSYTYFTPFPGGGLNTGGGNYAIEDDLSSPDSGYIKFRFINLMPDLAAGLDLYYGTGYTSTTSVKVAGPILYQGVSDYFTVALNTGSSWSIRPAGALATTTAIATYASASSVVNQRVFTITSRGYNSITSTTDVRRRLFSFIYNR